jgi:hypothetical protein
MTEIEFKALAAQGYNRIPLVAETYADLDTPLGIYLKLAHSGPLAGRMTCLMESVVGGERFGRYSFIGLPAQVRLTARGRQVEVRDGAHVVETFDGDPLAFVPRPVAEHKDRAFVEARAARQALQGEAQMFRPPIAEDGDRRVRRRHCGLTVTHSCSQSRVDNSLYRWCSADRTPCLFCRISVSIFHASHHRSSGLSVAVSSASTSRP